ncbi:hypothetical protein PHMEG_000680 [Phytophthora megakarya]|uniref:Protein Lines N-terminal domain-containing protein n=1 Tax=Phytophthora megakarya TaxID=4795 RepID=A0A225X3H9_9STRA|nr:hypothetical protein PHMEG_000680 [Phytophthora megakarya]
MARMDLPMALEYVAPDQSGVLAALHSVSSTMFIMTPMDWCVAIRRLEECSEASQSGREALDAKITTLLAFLDHEDILVAYAAKEKLLKVLLGENMAEIKSVNDIVKALVVTSSAVWRREASGFRLQLLRQLIKKKDEMRKGSGEGDEAECIVEFSYLQIVLENLAQVRTMVHTVFTFEGRSEQNDESLSTVTAPYSVQYEVLAFLSDFVKLLYNLEVNRCVQLELSEQMMSLMVDVFVAMDYISQPTFVTCAVLSLLGDFQGLLKVWRGKWQNDDDKMERLYSKWLEKCLIWLVQSSCSSTALRLINDEDPSHVASQDAFIGRSGRYPFLQQWLLCVSRVDVALLEASCTREKIATREKLQLLNFPERAHAWGQGQLPTRQQLFEVLAEQDDVMIEVLYALTLMMTPLDGADDTIPLLLVAELCPAFTIHLTTEYDPDLLFVDLLDILGRDHLVILDLLTSNETLMLEYFMRYLRRLSTNWKVSIQKLQAAERLEIVMSVLIRLRLEIDRLVASDLFPYGAGPLTRRLLTIEQLYEEQSDDVGEL